MHVGSGSSGGGAARQQQQRRRLLWRPPAGAPPREAPQNDHRDDMASSHGAGARLALRDILRRGQGGSPPLSLSAAVQ